MKKQAKTNKEAKAFTLIEVLLTLVIVTVVMGAVISLFLSTYEGAQTTVDYTRASLLANEGIEAVRTIRDTNYLDLEDGIYGLNRAGGYHLMSQPEIIDGVYTRTVVVESVFRDPSGNIAPTGIPDSETKHVTVNITFPAAGIGSRSTSSSTYITNWRASEFIHTLFADFDPESVTNIETLTGEPPPVGNGAIKLDSTFVPDGFYSSANIGHHGNDVVITPDRKYAFITTESDYNGLVVVDIQDTFNLQVVANLDIAGKGEGMALKGDLLAIGVGNADHGFSLVDVSNPLSPTLLSNINILGGSGRNVVFHPNSDVVFVTTDRSSRGVVVVDIGNTANPSVITSYDLDGDGGGVAVEVKDYLLFVGTEAGHDQDYGLNILDISDIENPIIINRVAFGDEEYASGFVFDYPFVYMSLKYGDSEFAIGRISETNEIHLVDQRNITSGEGSDITRSNNLIVFGAGDQNKGIVILDNTEPANPEVVEIRDIGSKVNGVSFMPPYIAVATDTSNKGFVLIGSGNRGYPTSGEYTSRPIDIGSIFPEYLSVSFDGIFPATTSASIELRSADSILALNNASWTAPFSQSPSRVTLPAGRYLQYKVNLAGNGSNTPVIDEIKINYLP